MSVDGSPRSFVVEGLTIRLADGQTVAVDPFALTIVGGDQEYAPKVDAREKARLLGVDIATVYRHASDLGGSKVGGAWRFPRELEPSPKDRPAIRRGSRQGASREQSERRGGSLQVRGNRPPKSV